MMNKEACVGESSSKRQENGDVSKELDRPLKKARFAWQVKGKYHLKNDSSAVFKNATSNIDDKTNSNSLSESESTTIDPMVNTEQNLEILGDYLLKQDYNSSVTDSDQHFNQSNTSQSLLYPKYKASISEGFSRDNTFTLETQPVTAPLSPSFYEDQCIARWQARQKAKGFVDNTINRVLDSWMVAPLPGDMDRFLAFDVAEFVNNMPENNTIENEGILMAISAHGLQNPSSSSNTNSSLNNISTSSNNKEYPFSSSPSSSIVTNEDVNEESSKYLDGTSTEAETSWSCDDKYPKNCGGKPLFSSDDAIDCYKNNSLNHIQSSSHKYNESNDNTSSNEFITSHFDFMDAAVSFAIQSKGLTS